MEEKLEKNEVEKEEVKKSAPKKKNPIIYEITKLLLKLVTVAIVVVSLFTYIFGFHRVKNLEMEPSITGGDAVVYYRMNKKFFIGDVVVYEYKGVKQLARVVALPNDEVDVDEKGLKVNNTYQYEPKVYKSTLAFEKGVKFPVKLKEDEYFIMGDNRDSAKDSRLFGGIKMKDILGKVFFILRNRGI